MPLDDLHRVLGDLLGYEHWWQATSPARDQAINAAGLAMRKPDGRVLFVRHGQRGTWEFPGGMIEPGEAPEQAAQREAIEEAGAPEGLALTPAAEIDSNGVHYTLLIAGVPEDFVPSLADGELVDWLWASPESPPDPLHPGLPEALGCLAQDRQTIAQDAELAFDRSVRTYDQNGHLNVALAPISKATVNEYYGHEIPDADKLGLDPERRYRLYRDPEELAKAASTFDGKPILLKHQPVSADAHPRDLTVGSIGSGARFEHPYLLAPLSFWDRDAIQGIEREDRKQLSAAYRYRADMTPGTADGQRYDGVMRDIAGNHLALVPEGRAGADVVVGDSKPKETHMPAAKPAAAKVQMSRQALFLSGVCTAYALPKLATDQKMPDLRPLLKGVTHKTWKDKRTAFEAEFGKTLKPRLAQDASMEDFHSFLDGFSNGGGEGGAPASAEELADDPLKPKTADAEPFGGEETPDEELLEADTPAGKLMKFLQSVLTPEELAQAKAIAQGNGEEASPAPPDNGEQPPSEDQGNPEIDDMQRRREGEQNEKPPITKPAMDAAIAAAVKAERERSLAVRDAEEAVRPWIGKLAIAQDSAEAIYKLALDSLGIDITDVHPSAYKTILLREPKPGERQRTEVVAMDAAQSKEFAERYPGALSLKRA